MQESINRNNIDKIKSDLGANYREEDEKVLEDILEEISSIAFNISNNRNKEELFPYIKTAVKSTYLCRGAEGLQNINESGKSSSFEDIINKLRNDIIKNRLRRLK